MVIALTNGHTAEIDDADCGLVKPFKWYANQPHPGARYAMTTDRKHLYMHRIILGVRKGQQVDHKDGNGLNNRRSNLRIATIFQQNANRGKMSSNSSGFKGVHYRRNHRSKPWRAQLYFQNKYIFIGDFASAIEAGQKYDEKALALFGDFARLNFPK